MQEGREMRDHVTCSVSNELSDRVERLLRSVGEGASGARPESFGFSAEYQRAARIKRRSVTQKKKLEIFQRDHFIDRYTGERLFFNGALLLLGQMFPKAFPTPASGGNWRVAECHWIYWRLAPSVDHYIPVMRAPDDVDVSGDDNLVTTSMMINTAKDVWTGEETPELIRFSLIPLEDVQRQEWDGMLGWCLDYVDRHPAVLTGSRELDGWIKVARSARKAAATAQSST